jgi:hypothetical protein
MKRTKKEEKRAHKPFSPIYITKRERNKRKAKTRRNADHKLKCHKGTWAKLPRYARAQSHRKTTRLKGPKLTSRVRIYVPPKKGFNPLKEVARPVCRTKLLKTNRRLCKKLQWLLLGTVFRARYFLAELSSFVMENSGWLIINKPLPYSLIAPVIRSLCICPNNVYHALMKTIIDEL